MTREEILEAIRAHLADELEVDPGRIDESTRFKEDLEADSLAVTTHLYPRFEAERFGAGRLTKIRAQTVSGRSCRQVAERLGLPRRLEEAAPPGASVAGLIRTERVLASVVEALIGACYLAF